jgi:uncharacterized protein YukE
MPRIKAITDEMRVRARNVSDRSNEILSSQQTVTKIVGNMGPDFSGKVPSLMTQNLLAMDEKYKGMNDTLTQYAKFLDNAANTYEWSDQEIARWAGALRTDTTTLVNSNTNTGANGNSSTGADGNGTDAASNTLNSSYYTPQNIGGAPRYGELNSIDGKQHVNCVYYARARAMEVNSMDTWTQGTKGAMQSNSIACFSSHDVYIEKVYTAENGELRVSFSESNWGGTTDPHPDDLSYAEFIQRRGTPNVIYNF